MNSNDTAHRALRTAYAAALILAAACNRPEPAPAGADSAQPTTNAEHDSLRARADRDRVAGDTAADLWVIVASDFQCPYCAQWHRETHQALRDEYVKTGKIRIAYLNFPLEQHPHAMPAAVAALCAGVQGKFWPVHDAIFASQSAWAPTPDARAMFMAIALRAGVDSASWRRCMDGKIMEPVARADYERAEAAGVQSTPTFIVSAAKPPARRGHILRGAAPITAFRTVLDSMLAAGRAR